MVTVIRAGRGEQGEHRVSLLASQATAPVAPTSVSVFGTLYALPYALTDRLLQTISGQVQRFAHVGSFGNGFFVRKPKNTPLDSFFHASNPADGSATPCQATASSAGGSLAGRKKLSFCFDDSTMLIDSVGMDQHERFSPDPTHLHHARSADAPAPLHLHHTRSADCADPANESGGSMFGECFTPSQCLPSPSSSCSDFSTPHGLPPRPPRPGARRPGQCASLQRNGSSGSGSSPNHSAHCSAAEIHVLPGILETCQSEPMDFGCPTGTAFTPECVLMGQFSDAGIRSYQEDVTCAVQLGSPAGASLFAVCDGHGGEHVSKCIADSITYAIQEQLDYVLSSGADAIGELLLDIEQGLPEEHGRVQGSTATVGLVVGGRLEVAHVGDSRLILGKESAEPDSNGNHPVSAVAVTDDHNPEHNELERNRILSASARIDGGYVGGVLQVSRSIGDFQAKELLMSQHNSEVILSTPDTVTVFLCERTKFAVAVSDGITSVMDDQMIVDQVVQHLNNPAHFNDPNFAARELVDYAINVKGSDDNCSAVVVCFSSKPPDMPVRRRRLNLTRRTADGTAL